jgi:hypothetical protein
MKTTDASDKAKAKRIIRELRKLKKKDFDKGTITEMVVKQIYNTGINEAIGAVIREFNIKD